MALKAIGSLKREETPNGKTIFKGWCGNVPARAAFGTKDGDRDTMYVFLDVDRASYLHSKKAS
ncbi:MAG: hypothetical protein KKH94_04195 [Candidatus Omnitrophica bacterium]|nr:hypothetical protein [Candidatus Omnitrophota bacterium]